jgi:hypothetical protein
MIIHKSLSVSFFTFYILAHSIEKEKNKIAALPPFLHTHLKGICRTINDSSTQRRKQKEDNKLVFSASINDKRDEPNELK